MTQDRQSIHMAKGPFDIAATGAAPVEPAMPTKEGPMTTTQVPPEPAVEPAPKKHSRTPLLVAVGVLALLAAFTAGAATTSTPPPKPTPAKTVTKTVTEPVTPAACTQFVELAQRIIALAAETSAATAEGWEAASRFDAAGIDAATAKVNGITPQVELLTPQYQAARDECLAS